MVLCLYGARLYVILDIHNIAWMVYRVLVTAPSAYDALFISHITNNVDGDDESTKYGSASAIVIC